MAAPAVTALVLAYPPKPLRPNARPNRYEKAAAVREYRYACKVDALNYMRRHGIESPLPAPVELVVTFSVAAGPLPDPDNALASFKAGIDGLVDARLLVDDNADVLKLGAPVVKRGHSSVVVVRLRSIGAGEEP